MIVVAAVVAFLLGSIPTADWVGALYGVDVRRDGTRNPGTANVVGLVGRRAGALVLVVDVAKGAVAVVLGRLLAGDAGGLVAALAAPAGQIFNPWYGFRGGKGLATTLGALIVAWPWGVVAGVAGLGAAIRITGSTARGALVAMAGFVALAAGWGLGGLPNAWGVAATGSLPVFAVGLVALLAPKFVRDVGDERSASGRGAGDLG